MNGYDPTATNIAIVEALGLDPKTIRRGGVRITLDEDHGPVVEVEFNHTLCDNWGDLVRRYRLVPVDDDGVTDWSAVDKA